MAFEIRQFGIVLAVAILFSIFVFSLGNALTPERDYPAICEEAQDDTLRPTAYVPYRENVNCTELPEPTQEEIDACPGQLQPDYRGKQCPETYTCSCYNLTEEFRNTEDDIQFWVAIILGGLAIVGGMILPRGKAIHDWIGTGFILGGLISVFFATAIYWENISKIARPLVILLELVLVLWLAYKRFGPEDKPKKKR